MKLNKQSQVTVSHSQTIKQSHNYQSAEATYGVQIICDSDPESIAKATKRAESLVEKALVAKLSQQRALLVKLGEQNK